MLQRGGGGDGKNENFVPHVGKIITFTRSHARGLKLNRLVQCLLCSDDFLYEIFLKGREIKIKRHDSNFK
jgi:hypothetical protein